MLTALWIILGLIGLTVASGQAVQGSMAVGGRLGVSPWVAGLTIASIGSSVPEVATNMAAAWRTRAGIDASGIAVGNVIGSCLSQITLLTGIVGTIACVALSRANVLKQGGAVLGAMGLMYLVCVDGTAARWEGALLVTAYVVYVAVVVVVGRGDGDQTDEDREKQREAMAGSLTADVVRALIGLVAVGLCADLVVDQALGVARSYGVTPAVIGLLVGVGTGLPELTISLRGVRDEASGLSVGNLLGSNVTDPLFSFGMGASVAALQVPTLSLSVDFACWAVATLIALALMFWRRQIDRLVGLCLLVLFGLCMAFRFMNST